MPIVSIIIPSFNRADMLPSTLNSVANQSFQDWECIVVDDMSTDDTKSVVLGYCERDIRFKYLVNTRKKGAQGARNTGLYESRAEWVFFFDSDNRMHRDLIESLLSAATPETDVCKCFSELRDISNDQFVSVLGWVANGNIHKSLFDGETYVDFNQEIIRRDRVMEIGGLDEDCPSLQEFDTNIRLSRKCCYLTVEKSLIDCFIGGYGKISANNITQVKGKYYNLLKYKKEWLENKHNANRMIYELYEKLKLVDSIGFRMKYAFRLVFNFPEMWPYYAKRICMKCIKATKLYGKKDS